MCFLLYGFQKHIVGIRTKKGKKKKEKIAPRRCTPSNLSHQGYIVEAQQSSTIIENELGWHCSRSGKSHRLGASDIFVKKRQITKICEPWCS